MLKGVKEFLRSRDGNISLLYALTLPVVILATGMAVDYGRSAQVRTKLNAAADSAVLAGLTPAMLQQPASIAQAAVTDMFNGQIAGISGIVPGSVSFNPVVAPSSTNALIRNVTANYTASVATDFAGVLGVSSITVGGTALASAQTPPNIDFYLLLDNSPSMSLPATTAGITQMQNLTSAQESGGCAFACHQASTGNGDTVGNPCANGSAAGSNGYCSQSQGAQIDNYALARLNSITLRLDELNSAVSTLMQTASTNSSSPIYSTPPAYRFAVNSIDSTWSIGFNSIMALTGSYATKWANYSSNFGVMEMFANNDGCGNSGCTVDNGVGDVASNYDDAMSNALTQLPTPGNGSNVAGDKPQEVLFFVTDGVEDEMSGSIRLIQAINAGTAHNYCNDIKAKGVRIAILYTEYLPVPVNSYYVQNVEPILPQVGPALQACASPGLFYDAAIGDDLSQALSSLFQAVVQSAHLTQ